MDAGTLVEWLVHPGATVHRGDIVARVETDKADVEVEIFESGVIDRLLVQEGEKVPVGTLLATLKPLGSEEAVTAAAAAAIPPPAIPKVPIEPPGAPEPGTLQHATRAAERLARERGVDLSRIIAKAGRRITVADVEQAIRPGQPLPAPVKASPRARRLARQLGVVLHTLAGTGPGGAVTAADVERTAVPTSAAQPAVAPPAGLRSRADRVVARQRATATAMARSKREIPHYYLGAAVDLSTALAWLERENLTRPVAERVLPAALLLKAAALACHDVPEMNGHWADGRFQGSDAVHLGVAISLREGGLVAPAIHDADMLRIDELMAALRDLVKRARAGSLRSSEMTDPTITVTNLGEQGADTVFPVIFPPQVAIVGFGRVSERPWAVNGMLGVRPIVSCSLAADHRVTDGHAGSRFLTAIERILQDPATL